MTSIALLFALQAATATAPRVDSLTGPGVSQALARWRAARVRDVRYELALDVSARDSARGRVVVRFVRTGSGDAILDWRGPSVRGAMANGRPVAGLRTNGAHVRVPAGALRTGENTIAFDFT